MSKITKTAALLAAALVSSTLYTSPATPVSAESGFDESNIVLRFGVLSDVHMSGSWNTAGHSKLNRAYKGLLALAGTDESGATLLDAVFIDGDITDAMNSTGNVSSSMHKLKQNYIELAAFRDITLDNFNSDDKTDNVAVIYANGNHDTQGGMARDENGNLDTTGFYSAKLMQKIISGYTWQDTVPDNSDATEDEIAEYNKTLIKAFDETTGEHYGFFYGGDLYLGENGLDYGNRHVEVGDYHFLTVEPQSYHSTVYTDETIAWLDETLAEITASEPNKAVFVATHPRVTNTVFASSESGGASSGLISTLNKHHMGRTQPFTAQPRACDMARRRGNIYRC